MAERRSGVFLLVAVFVIAICGLVYELIAASLSSYLLGASITHFSIVIGVFLTAMGIGSYLTRFVKRGLVDAFVGIQIGIGLAGGLSAAALLLTFTLLDAYLAILLVVLLVNGALVGMEIPLIIRILQTKQALRITVANVLALDYLGALIASCAFPLILVPFLGLLRTSYLFGLINLSVALVAIRVLAPMLTMKRTLVVSACVSIGVLIVGFATAGRFSSFTEDILYQDDIIFTKQTEYQRLVVTRWRDDIRLFIDGNLQFSSVDEHRYHEALIHPAMSATPAAKRILILGGGDGMAARELLKYDQIEKIDLVDLDKEMIRLFRNRKLLARLSNDALSDHRVHIHIEDAGKFLERSNEVWDIIVIDLPDPNTLSLARLYTRSFYRLCGRRLAAQGVIVTQATSPFYAPEAFWCVVQTWKDTPAGPNGKQFQVYPYHAHVPSFGDWGFVMVSRRVIEPRTLTLRPSIHMKFLTNDLLQSLFSFPKDILPTSKVRSNRIDDHVLVKYYRRGWRRFGP
jgi:spermidine synthase